MIAVPVHQVVPVPPVLLAQLLQDLLHLLLREVRVTQVVYLNCSLSSEASLGQMSKTPEKGNGCPPGLKALDK